ncbi:hypothetical protein SteCoe_12138 [Stentor coeruleus]|uniref:PIH1 N-terminal domain-containing protein n=1 Tax=Stentor coeruleus TaxID=5963 RepID=A0A1R2CBG7_9CILI|nr:hypothetical protein SteCoe_12138 [Stentor coeruleus]
MEALNFLKNMQNLPSDFLSDPSTQNQMKNFWSMLDEMAVNNPEEYSKFIKKNLEQGAEEFKESSGKSKFQGEFSYCIKTYTENKRQIVLINMCCNENVLEPLNDAREIADRGKVNTWRTIPVSFSKRREKKVEGKKVMWYFDALVHSVVIDMALKDLKFKAYVTGTVCMRLEMKEKFKLLYEKGEFDYFESYKGPDNEPSPQPQFLDPAADPEEYKKYFKGNTHTELTERTNSQKISELSLTPKPQKPKSTIEVLTSQPVLQPKVQEISEEPKPQAKKILIEEIKNYHIKISEDKRQGNVEVNEHEKEVEIFIHLPDENGMKGVILDATQKSIKVRCLSFACEVFFDKFSLDDRSISAKWLKSKKRLIVKAPIII